MPFRVLMIDDHAVLGDALKIHVNSVEGMEMLTPHTTARAGLACAKVERPDAVIVDLNLPDRHGIEVIGDLKAMDPDVKILVLTALKDPKILDEALAAGASIAFEKTVTSGEIIDALKELQTSPIEANGRQDQNQTAVSVTGRLTPREKEVLVLIAQGQTTPQIADGLRVTASTAETHRENLMRKLDLHSIAELTAYAMRRGLVEP